MKVHLFQLSITCCPLFNLLRHVQSWTPYWIVLFLYQDKTRNIRSNTPLRLKEFHHFTSPKLLNQKLGKTQSQIWDVRVTPNMLPNWQVSNSNSLGMSALKKFKCEGWGIYWLNADDAVCWDATATLGFLNIPSQKLLFWWKEGIWIYAYKNHEISYQSPKLCICTSLNSYLKIAQRSNCLNPNLKNPNGKIDSQSHSLSISKYTYYSSLLWGRVWMSYRKSIGWRQKS